MKINEMDDAQLRRAYVITCKQFNQAYKDKKDIETEMYERFNREIEEIERGNKI